MPGGQSIGVKLNTLGVLVVGHHLVSILAREKITRRKSENSKLVILLQKSMDKRLKKMGDVTPFVQQAGEKGEALNLVIQPDNEVLQVPSCL